MKNTRTGAWLWLTMMTVGCGNELSLGELRCSGPEVRCEEHSAEEIPYPYPLVEPTIVAEKQATVVWLRNVMPPHCSVEACFHGEPQFVVHDDGSITAALALSTGTEGAPHRSESWLVRVGADGTLLAQERIENVGSQDISPHLALTLDASGVALLAAQYTDEIRLYTVDGASKLSPLFQVGDAREFQLRAVVAADSDVILMREYSEGHEIERYDRAGTLKHRQTRLLGEHSARTASANGQAPMSIHRGISAREPQRVWVLMAENELNYQLASLGAGGNVSWNAHFTFGSASRQSFLQIDGKGRPVAALDSDGYALLRFASEQPERVEVAWWRRRDQYYSARPSGLVLDAEGRLYVLAESGLRDARVLLVERLSDDFLRLERFSLPAPELQADGRWVQPLQLAPDGNVYMGVYADGALQLGRVKLD